MAVGAIIRTLTIWTILEISELLLKLIISVLTYLLALHLGLLQNVLVLLLGSLQLSLANPEFILNPSNFTLLLVQDTLEFELQLLLSISSILEKRHLELLLLLLKFFNALIKDLNVKFQLLLYLDVVSDFGLILLQLLLVFFGW